MARRRIRGLKGAGPAAATALVIALAGCSGQPQTPQTAPVKGQATGTRLTFGWFSPGRAPATWARASLPSQTATLSYPRSLRTMKGDPGTVSAGLQSPAGLVLVYLNVTPQQGGETLAGWPSFRVDHLREEGQRAVHIDASSAQLRFRGGNGRCVIDDYTTKVHANHYREIACFVRAADGGSVLVAATPVAKWPVYASLLERAVSAYQAN